MSEFYDNLLFLFQNRDISLPKNTLYGRLILMQKSKNVYEGYEYYDEDFLLEYPLIEGSPYFNEFSLTDINDRIRIVDDINKDICNGSWDKKYGDTIYSIFYHVDNVRYIYENSGVECPQWYKNKYGNLFYKKKTKYNSKYF